MPTVLIIDDDPNARDYVRKKAPTSWTFLEAADGLSGVDLVRQHYRELDLVVLDLQLPHLDGRTACIRIRDMRADLPILPFTGHTDPATVLDAYGCLEPVFKPARPEVLEQRLREAIKQPMPPVNTTPLGDLAREHSEQIERLVRRQQIDLRVIVYVESPIKRAGLEQTLASLAQVRDAHSLAELDMHLHRSSWTAVIADAGAVASLLALSAMQHVPIIVLAVDSVDARSVDTVSVAAVLVEYDPALPARLRDVLTALAAGERPEPLILPDEPDPDDRHVVPPRIVKLFDGKGLSRRELDLIWLAYKHLSAREIARKLGIAELTIGSRWRTIAGKLNLSRPEAEAWTRARITDANRQRDADA